jgi:chromate transporter
MNTAEQSVGSVAGVPAEPLGRLFLRFLHFGCLAWGGPVPQIAMLRQAFVEEQKWVSSAQFNRVLAVYQVLPGPEAHEMCVYFGMLSRGRVGGLLAGLGFMLPGFVLMFALSWLYVRYGLDTGGTAGILFASVQAGVAALIVTATCRIGAHVLLNGWLWAIGVLAFVAQLLATPFAITLAAGGFLYLLARARLCIAALFATACGAALVILAYQSGFELPALRAATEVTDAQTTREVTAVALFIAGLKAGLLTFGGAYTAIPLLQDDAVVKGGWMTNAQFLDGLGLGGLLPAPMIIFGTFVGYIGGGPLGAVLLTLGIFLPAFAFTLVAHEPLERLVQQPRIRAFLDGVTAAVVGLIAGTAITLILPALSGWTTAVIFGLALGALFYWNVRLLIPMVIAAAAALGWIAHVLL